jgi:aryl carrier-like protein
MAELKPRQITHKDLVIGLDELSIAMAAVQERWTQRGLAIGLDYPHDALMLAAANDIINNRTDNALAFLDLSTVINKILPQVTIEI